MTDPETSAALIRAIVESLRGASDDWESLSIVLTVSGTRVSGTSGFAYDAAGDISPVAARPSGVSPAAAAYLGDLYPDGASMPAAMLVQYERGTGRYEMTFEDTDPARWRVTPTNLATLREQLRPRFA